MEKKYEILKDTKERFLGREVYRIRALKDFADVKKGDIGGYVESEYNLSQAGDCWIYDNAVACDNSVVKDNAKICDRSIVYDYSIICDNSVVCNRALICNYAKVGDYAIVCDYAVVRGYARVGYNAKIKCKNQWFVVENVGSRNDNITFYETDGVIYVNVGCFNGTLDEFIGTVKKTHKGNKFEKEYLQMAELAKVKLGGLDE